MSSRSEMKFIKRIESHEYINNEPRSLSIYVKNVNHNFDTPLRASLKSGRKTLALMILMNKSVNVHNHDNICIWYAIELNNHNLLSALVSRGEKQSLRHFFSDPVVLDLVVRKGNSDIIKIIGSYKFNNSLKISSYIHESETCKKLLRECNGTIGSKKSDRDEFFIKIERGNYVKTLKSIKHYIPKYNNDQILLRWAALGKYKLLRELLSVSYIYKYYYEKMLIKCVSRIDNDNHVKPHMMCFKLLIDSNDHVIDKNSNSIMRKDVLEKIRKYSLIQQIV